MDRDGETDCVICFAYKLDIGRFAFLPRMCGDGSQPTIKYNIIAKKMYPTNNNKKYAVFMAANSMHNKFDKRIK